MTFGAIASSCVIKIVFTCQADSMISIIFSIFSKNRPSRLWYIFGIRIARTNSTKHKLWLIDSYSVRTKKTIHISSRFACIFEVNLYKKTFSLPVFFFDACSSHTESINLKNIWTVFLVQNLIFLTPHSVNQSRLYNARYRLQNYLLKI